MIAWVAELRLATSFLTRIPLGAQAGVDERLLGRCVAWFPLVGLLLGALLAGTARLLDGVFPSAALAALLVVLLVAATGALHLDGVADLADGCYGGRDRESRLRIMKDSRVGSMGVVAVVCVLLLKFAALASYPPQRLWPALLLAPAAGRWVMAALAVSTPYARPEGGTGGAFVTRSGPRELIVAGGIFAAAGGTLLGSAVVPLLLLTALLWLAVRSYALHKLGGVTGDVLGAACEWGEAAVLLFLSAHPFHTP